MLAQMDGGITIQNLQRKYDNKIKAAMIFCNIVLDRPYKQLKHKEKVDALRLDEMKNLVAQGKAQDVIKHSDVKYVVPWSAEMIALVSRINKNDYNSVKKTNPQGNQQNEPKRKGHR